MDRVVAIAGFLFVFGALAGLLLVPLKSPRRRSRLHRLKSLDDVQSQHGSTHLRLRPSSVIAVGAAAIIGLCFLPLTCGFAMTVMVVRLVHRASLSRQRAQQPVEAGSAQQPLILQSDILRRA